MWILGTMLLFMGVGYMQAQQVPESRTDRQADSAMAGVTKLEERSVDVERRVTKLETMQEYGMGALVANLAAHLFQISGGRKRRRITSGPNVIITGGDE